MSRQAESGNWLSAERGAFVFIILLVAALAGIWWSRRGSWRDHNTMVQPRAELEYLDRIDPNTADWQTMACLPDVGERRAKLIVEYRDSRPAPAFTQPDDLLAVRQFGPKTVQTIRPFLVFPQVCIEPPPNDPNVPDPTRKIPAADK